jgi:hypothetical protein
MTKKIETPESLTLSCYTESIYLEAPYNGFGTQPKILIWNKAHVYNEVVRPDRGGDKKPDTFRPEMLALAKKIQVAYNAHAMSMKAMQRALDLLEALPATAEVQAHVSNAFRGRVCGELRLAIEAGEVRQ